MFSFFSVHIGRRHELHYLNGRMYLNYSSAAKCENGTGENDTYKLIIMLKCDYTMDANPFHITPHVSRLLHL